MPDVSLDKSIDGQLTWSIPPSGRFRSAVGGLRTRATIVAISRRKGVRDPGSLLKHLDVFKPQ